jgi:cytochrome P450
MSDVRAVPGRDKSGIWFGGLLMQWEEMTTKMHSWVETHQKKYDGATVFISEAGMRTVTVTDAVAAEYIFNAPVSLLTRMDNNGFGPLVLRPEMVGPIQPALVASGTCHHQARAFLDPLMTKRLPDFDQVLTTEANNLFERWQSDPEVSLGDEIRNFGPQVVARWLLDIDLYGPSTGEWLNNSATINTPSKIDNFLVGKLESLPKEALAASEGIHTAIKGSRYWPEIAQLGREVGYTGEEAASQLAFMMLFNTAAEGFNLFSTLCQFAVTPKWADVVRNAVGGDPFTPSSMSDYPVLQQIFMEANRLYSLPRLYYRKAHADFVLPAAGGVRYQLKADDVILLVMRGVHTDPTIFDNPTDFDPDRYAPGNELERYTFVFGGPKRPFRCAGADVHIAARWWKYMLARLVQGFEWELSPAPAVSPDNASGGSPADLSMIDFRKRAV